MDPLTEALDKHFPGRTKKSALWTLLLAVSWLLLGCDKELRPLLLFMSVMTVIMIVMTIIDPWIDPWLRKYGIRK